MGGLLVTPTRPYTFLRGAPLTTTGPVIKALVHEGNLFRACRWGIDIRSTNIEGLQGIKKELQMQLQGLRLPKPAIAWAPSPCRRGSVSKLSLRSDSGTQVSAIPSRSHRQGATLGS